MDSLRLDDMAPGESRPCRLDFRRREELASDPLASVQVTVAPNTGLTLGAATIVGTEIRLRLTAVSVGSYRLTVSGTTQTNAYIEIGYVDVTVALPP